MKAADMEVVLATLAKACSRRIVMGVMDVPEEGCDFSVDSTTCAMNGTQESYGLPFMTDIPELIGDLPKATERARPHLKADAEKGVLHAPNNEGLPTVAEVGLDIRMVKKVLMRAKHATDGEIEPLPSWTSAQVNVAPPRLTMQSWPTGLVQIMRLTRRSSPCPSRTSA